MLPFILTPEAESRLEALEEIEFTFRVWGKTPDNKLAIEVFAQDMTGVGNFRYVQFESFKQGKISAHIPSNHLEFIRGVTVNFVGWSDEYEERYSYDLTFVHRGFECLPHEVDFSELQLTTIQALSILEKTFFMNLNPPFMSHATNAALEHLRFHRAIGESMPSDEEFVKMSFSLKELNEAIGYGFQESGL